MEVKVEGLGTFTVGDNICGDSICSSDFYIKNLIANNERLKEENETLKKTVLELTELLKEK